MNRDAEASLREPNRTFFRRHLAGRLSLRRSLWLNTVLPALVLLLVLGWLDAWLRLHGSLLRAGSLALLLGWPLLMALLVWGLLGVWRATRREDLYVGIPRWRRLGAPALVALLLVLALALFGLNVAPRLAELGTQAVWHDPLGEVEVALSADGRRLHIQGPLSRGSGDRVQAVLQSAPQLRLVSIASDAGHLDEAMQIARLLRAPQLPTRASAGCSGVCPLVFLAGARRQLLPGAHLGFQRISAGRFNPPHQTWVNAALRKQLASLGLTPHMVTKVLATPPTRLWVPDVDELTAAGLLSQPERPLDVDLPSPQDATLADYREALSASGLWQALDRRFPGTLADAAQRMLAAGSAGADAVQAAGHDVVAALMPQLLARASPETRWLYTDILLAQVGFLRTVDPVLCRGLLLGDAAAHRQLPRALVWREAEWLLAALEEAPRSTSTRAPTRIEQEVIRHTLGARAPQQLAGLWRPLAPPAPGEPDCERAQTLLSELGSIAAPQRRLALRLMYERQ